MYLQYVAFFNYSGTTNGLRAVHTRVRHVQGVFLVGCPTNRGSQGVFLVPLFMFLFTISGLPSLSIGVGNVRVYRLFVKGPRVPTNFQSLRCGGIHHTIVTIHPRLRCRLNYALQKCGQDCLYPTNSTSGLQRVRKGPNSASGRVYPYHGYYLSVLFMVLWYGRGVSARGSISANGLLYFPSVFFSNFWIATYLVVLRTFFVMTSLHDEGSASATLLYRHSHRVTSTSSCPRTALSSQGFYGRVPSLRLFRL